MATAAPALMPAAGQYFPVVPVKVLDTRSGVGGVSVAPLAANGSASFPVTSVGQVPQDGQVSDVYVVVNAISPTASGCLTDYSADNTDPGICNTSFQAGQSVSVSDLVQVSVGGNISVANHSTGTVDVAVTVMGYYQTDNTQAAGDTYVSLPESAIVDTRNGTGAPQAQIPGGGSLTVQVTGHGGIPSGAAGAALFIGSSNASSAGFVSAYPAGGTPSSLAILNYVPFRTERDLYLGALSSTGQLTLVNQGTSPVDLIVDVDGYLNGPASSPAGGSYNGLTPARIVTQAAGQLAAGASLTFAAAGAGGVPSSGVASVAESVAALGATGNGYLSVYPADSPDPNQPVVNFNSGDAQDNDLNASLVSSVSPSGQETVTNHSPGTVDVVVSVRGYYQAPAAPSAPESVSAVVSGQTATVTWLPPSTDGGSPITSYKVTAPPDAASVTVDGATQQASLTSLTNAASDTFTVTATSAAGTSVGGTPIGGASTGTFTQDIEVSVDPSTDAVSLVQGSASLTMIDSNGVTNSPLVTADTSDVFTVNGVSNGEACDISRINGVTVRTHRSFNNYASHNSFSTDWINHVFSVRNARKISGVAQWEGVLCTVGGGNTWNGWTLTLAEDSIFTNSTSANTLWNRKWSSRATDTSSISKSLGFSITAPGNYASINGGESLTFRARNAELTGGVGSDGHWGSNWPSGYNKYNPTRVNAEWGAVNLNGTTADFEGNVGLALYMYPMGTGPHHFHSFHLTKSVCLPIIGGSCPALY